MALILAGLVAYGTIFWTVLLVSANANSDAPSVQSVPVLPTFIGGMVIAGALAASHWINIGW